MNPRKIEMINRKNITMYSSRKIDHGYMALSPSQTPRSQVMSSIHSSRRNSFQDVQLRAMFHSLLTISPSVIFLRFVGREPCSVSSAGVPAAVMGVLSDSRRAVCVSAG